MIKLVASNILSAYADAAIGTRVLDRQGFEVILADAIETHDTAGDRVPGQHFIVLSEAAKATVSAGVGRRSADPADYVVREHRGRVDAYLKRELAAAVEGVAAVVYTAEAYLSDPDVEGEPEEAARVRESGASHVLVAVLAFAGPKAPLSPYRLVHNLAGGNREAEAWSAEEIRRIASEVLAYDSDWAVVAD